MTNRQRSTQASLTLRESELRQLRTKLDSFEKEPQAVYGSRRWTILGLYYSYRARIFALFAPDKARQKQAVQKQIGVLSDSGLFDSKWYLQENPDVARSGVDPVAHFIQSGAAEGRDPNPLFDTDWYLRQYPEVRNAGTNPLIHYLASGAIMGCDPHPLFDSDWYLQRYPDVAIAGRNPLAHYLERGASEGRNPNPLFNSEWYLREHPEVAKSGVNPLVDYLQSSSPKATPTTRA